MKTHSYDLELICGKNKFLSLNWSLIKDDKTSYIQLIILVYNVNMKTTAVSIVVYYRLTTIR